MRRHAGLRLLFQTTCQTFVGLQRFLDVRGSFHTLLKWVGFPHACAISCGGSLTASIHFVFCQRSVAEVPTQLFSICSMAVEFDYLLTLRFE